MRKIMTLLLVALLAFSIIVTFAACNDDGLGKGDPKSESTSDGTTESKGDSNVNSNENTSETTGGNTSETTNGGASETTNGGASETTTGNAQGPNLSPEQEDKDGPSFNPARPL